MLGALTILLVYQLIGEMLVLYFGLPIPGPVVGMLLLFAALCVRGTVSNGLRDTANGILQHLSLLFVPAGTGIVVHFSRVSGEWPAILAALAVSTALCIAVTALVMQWLIRLRGGHAAGGQT